MRLYGQDGVHRKSPSNNRSLVCIGTHSDMWMLGWIAIGLLWGRWCLKQGLSVFAWCRSSVISLLVSRFKSRNLKRGIGGFLKSAPLSDWYTRDRSKERGILANESAEFLACLVMVTSLLLRPHCGFPHKIHPGQKIHSPLMLSDNRKYTPKACPLDGDPNFWE